jgi:predicted transcriptional regulator
MQLKTGKLVKRKKSCFKRYSQVEKIHDTYNAINSSGEEFKEYGKVN